MLGEEMLTFSYRAFAYCVRCTATAGALQELASRLGDGIGHAEKYLRSHDKNISLRSGDTTRVDVEFSSRRPYSVHVRAEDQRRLQDALRELARQPERSAISLFELGLVTKEASENDLEFCLLNTIPALAADYDARMGGSTWEGYLLHDAPTVDALLLARDIWLGWVSKSPSGYERDVFVQTPEEMAKEQAPAAFERLLDSDDPAYQIVVYGEHPLTARFGSPHTLALAWFCTDSTESILSEHLVSTGDWRVDLANYLLYRDLIVEWVPILKPRRFGWGDMADGWPEEMYVPPEKLNDKELMWEWFRLNLGPGLGCTKIPAWVRSEFETLFASARQLAAQT